MTLKHLLSPLTGVFTHCELIDQMFVLVMELKADNC